MTKKSLLTALLFCLAFVSLNAQSGNGNGNGNGSGHGQHPLIPIEIKLKGGVEDDPQGLTGNSLIPVSASYTSDTTEYDGANAGILRSGTFAQRPTTGIYIGFRYFCTSGATVQGTPMTNIEIYYTGSSWVDALGRVVS